MKHITFGEYVFTPIKNADNEQLSVWISKRGYVIAAYCFSVKNQREAEKELKDEDIRKSYISYFEGVLSRKGVA